LPGRHAATAWRRRLGRGTVVVVLGATALGWISLQKQVVIRVEGRRVKAFRTYATTVGEALRRGRIEVGPHDQVAPARATPLSAAPVIDVLRAKPIVVVVDGSPRRVIATALTVGRALREASIVLGRADFVSSPPAFRTAAGMTVTVRHAVRVRVLYDRRVERPLTNAATVRQVLRNLGVRLHRRDIIRPGLSVAPRRGMTIRVLRVGTFVEEERRPIAWTTVQKQDRRLEYGLREVSPEGRDGVRAFRYRSTYVDGRLVVRKFLGSRVAQEPRNKVISIGAWFPSCACRRGSARGGATWFDARGLTAAHRTLAMNTIVRVINLSNGRSVNVIIRDRGPTGDGRIIDLSANAFRRLGSLDEGVLRVEIHW
jgi:resuscitation-promoting factor RpfB